MLILLRRLDTETLPDPHFLLLRTCENDDGAALCVSHARDPLTCSLNDADDFGGYRTYVGMILGTLTVCDGEI